MGPQFAPPEDMKRLRSGKNLEEVLSWLAYDPIYPLESICLDVRDKGVLQYLQTTNNASWQHCNPEATSHPISPQLHAQCNLYATYLCSPMIMSYDCRPTYQNFAPYRTKRLLYKCSSVAKTCPKAHLSSLQTNQSHARAVSFLDKTNVIQLLFSSCGSLSLLLSGCHGCLLSQLSHKVPVSIHVVDSGNSGPELGCLHPRCRESSLLSGVWEIPLLRQNDLSSVGSILQQVVLPAMTREQITPRPLSELLRNYAQIMHNQSTGS